ncbi:PE-PPE domain-containing protein [Mycolicibacterium psychrotolerans]|uniref:PE-PPE domain-containing protein n=1 Tax=Mycolicibacterium psychrotolerans TaxID=216929 RepID=A0A7I7MBD8_9MYCO|nr:PE-PPE domain-containing protein [Mycolicibacterium psychrotolerans]BBX68679.1 PE-PPE domain-containing protein [Mycolicibacterium psychrotolerans]
MATTLFAVAVAVLCGLASIVTSASATAGTALIMGGNSHPLSVPEDTPTFIKGYVGAAAADYLLPSGLCGPSCSLVAVYTPEQFRFVTGIFDMTFDESVAVGQANLDDCIRGAVCTVTFFPYTETVSQTVTGPSSVIFDYSESSTIASKQKLLLIAHPLAATVTFMMLANPSRPNGGILERFVGAYIPILGVTFSGATPTFSPQTAPLTTVDIARQYDGWADFPTNPLNLLSDANALMGTVLVHGNYFDVGAPQLQGQYQDTTYYLVPTAVAPLLTPLTWIPLVGKPLAIALDPAIRVLVETGYDRTINPGRPTPAQYRYVPNLFRAAKSFIMAMPTGWDDAISYITGDPGCRPFHTVKPATPYGVGGPPVYTGAVDPYGDPTPYLEPATSGTSKAPPVSERAQSADAERVPVDLEQTDGDLNDTPAVDAGESPLVAEHATSTHRSIDEPAADDTDEKKPATTDEHKTTWSEHEATSSDHDAATDVERDIRTSESTSSPADTDAADAAA